MTTAGKPCGPGAAAGNHSVAARASPLASTIVSCSAIPVLYVSPGVPAGAHTLVVVSYVTAPLGAMHGYKNAPVAGSVVGLPSPPGPCAPCSMATKSSGSPKTPLWSKSGR